MRRFAEVQRLTEPFFCLMGGSLSGLLPLHSQQSMANHLQIGQRAGHEQPIRILYEPRGNSGNDTLDGGTGMDTAVYSGARAAYSISHSGTTYTVAGGSDGTDTLTGIEWPQFSDALIHLGGAPALDSNGDGKSDIFWRNTSTGETSLWLMNGTAIDSTGGFGNIAADWQVAEAKADYSGDGKSDILWRNTSTGETSLWLMNGTAPRLHWRLRQCS